MRSLRTLLAAATVMVAAGAANAATLTLTQDQVASFAAYDTLTTYNVTSNPAATPLPTVTFFANTPVETTQQLFGAAYWRARVGLSGLADLTPYTQLALSHYGISDPYSGTFSTTQIVLRDDQANEIITTAALLNIGAAGFNWSAVTFLGIDILQLYGYTGAIAGAGVRILSGDYVTSADLFSESAVVPLPAGIVLLGSGIALMAALGRRRATENSPVRLRTGLRKRSLGVPGVGGDPGGLHASTTSLMTFGSGSLRKVSLSAQPSPPTGVLRERARAGHDGRQPAAGSQSCNRRVMGPLPATHDGTWLPYHRTMPLQTLQGERGQPSLLRDLVKQQLTLTECTAA